LARNKELVTGVQTALLPSVGLDSRVKPEPATNAALFFRLRR